MAGYNEIFTYDRQSWIDSDNYECSFKRHKNKPLVSKCSQCETLTCCSDGPFYDGCGTYCIFCDKAICGKCRLNNINNFMFCLTTTTHDEHIFTTCIGCLHLYNDYPRKDSWPGEDWFEKFNLDIPPINAFAISDMIELYDKELDKKDDEIAKLKQEIAHLKYKPGGKGAKEAQEHFEELVGEKN